MPHSVLSECYPILRFPVNLKNLCITVDSQWPYDHDSNVHNSAHLRQITTHPCFNDVQDLEHYTSSIVVDDGLIAVCEQGTLPSLDRLDFDLLDAESLSGIRAADFKGKYNHLKFWFVLITLAASFQHIVHNYS